jgi:molybdenum cofactor cytidylyltransferase
MRLDAVVLAAGVGSRFGGGKLFARWRGETLLERTLTAAYAAPVRSVSVVWGADDRVPEAAAEFAQRKGRTDRLCLVKSERCADGLAWSLKAGVMSLDAESAGAFIFLADMPRISTEITAALADALASGATAAAPTFEGRRGHPVLFASVLYPALLGLSGDRGAASILEGLKDGLALIPSRDDGILFDVDRPQDLRGSGGSLT